MAVHEVTYPPVPSVWHVESKYRLGYSSFLRNAVHHLQCCYTYQLILWLVSLFPLILSFQCYVQCLMEGFGYVSINSCQSQYPSGLRRWLVAALLLELWVRTPRGAWIFVCCEFCVLRGNVFCNWPTPKSRGVLLSVCVCLSVFHCHMVQQETLYTYNE